VRVWEVTGGVCVATLAGHASAVRALAVLPDGRLVSGSDDATVRLWEVGTRTWTAVLTGHTGSVTALAALPDGRLASGSDDSTIKMWDVRAATHRTRAVAAVTLVEEDSQPIPVRALLALPDWRLASASPDAVRRWELPPPRS
jgi:WD40 repeat protein